MQVWQKLKTAYHSASRRWPRAAALAAVLLVLLAALTLALWRHNGSTYLTGQWDTQSQDLVFGRMLQMQQGQSTPGGFLGTYGEDWSSTRDRYLFRDNALLPGEQYLSYVHQSGLQGWLLGWLNKVFSLFSDAGETRETWLYTANSTLLYAAALCVCLALWRNIGPLPAAAWLLAVLAAPWVQRGMKDLYWCLWTWMLPLLAVLLLCRTRHKGCYALVFLAAMARCMCGFEFISAILVLCELPLVWLWSDALINGREPRPWFHRMVGTGICAVGGVATALGVWLVQSRLYYGDWAQAAANLAETIVGRTALGDSAARAVTAGEVLRKYVLETAEPVLQLGPLTVTLPQLLAATVSAAALTAFVLALTRRTAALRSLLPSVLTWAVSFLGPVSWMVLSKAHSDAHPHIVPMLWHFAFVPCSCALWAILAQTLARGEGAGHVASDQAL